MRQKIKNLFGMWIVWHSAVAGAAFSGSFDVSAEGSYLPTGQRGNSSFQLASIRLEKDWFLAEGDTLVSRLRFNESHFLGKNTGIAEPVSIAYIDLSGSFKSAVSLQVGLTSNPVNEWSEKIWGLDNFGPAGYSFADKYGYFLNSAAGLAYYGRWQESGRWGIRLIGGQGPLVKDYAPHKDLQVWLQDELDENHSWAFSYVRGRYNSFSSELGLKERVWLQFSGTVSSQLAWAFEYFQGRDPANMVDQVLAQKVDVTNMLGKNIQSQGASIQSSLELREKSLFFLRLDWLQPAMGTELKKELKSYLVGWQYLLSPSVKSFLALEHSTYSKDYKLGAREEGKIILATSASF